MNFRSVYRAQALEKIAADCTPQLRSLNAAAFVDIAIGVAANAAGAHSQRTESTGDLSGFLFAQLPRAFTEQHSVLIIHTFLLVRIWVRCRPQALKKSRCGLRIQKSSPQRRAYQTPPHSPVSPSAPPAKLKVHAVKVWIPPFTWAVSCSFNSRAFWRSNTLFWLFMFTLLLDMHCTAVCRPRAPARAGGRVRG